MKYELKQRLLNSGFFEDNIWLDRYIDLIFNNRLDKHIVRFSQLHHGFPKCVSKLLNEKIDDSEENLFEIKFSLHILAHFYLSMCATNDSIKRSNIIACKWMAGGKLTQFLSEDIDEKLLQEIQNIYENNLSLVGENHPMYGRKRPDLSERNRLHHVSLKGDKNPMYGKRGELCPNYGKHPSEETKQKMRDSWKYEKHITNTTRKLHRENAIENSKNRTGMFSKESRDKALKTRIAKGNLKLAEDTKRKISEKAHKKKVVCVETGVVYESTMDAERKTKMYHSAISGCCKGKVKSVKLGNSYYHWRYVMEEK